jgi:hypothetical protein
VKAFSGKGVVLAGEQCYVPYDKFYIDSNDAELIHVLKMSVEEKLNEAVKAVKDGIEVVIRFANGKKSIQFFNRTEPISILYDFVWLSGTPNKKFYLVDFHSKEKLVELETPLMVIEDNGCVMITVCEV